MIGYLGDILFTVSSEKILTPSNIRWGGSARYAEHQRHCNYALTEFTGVNADYFPMDITLSRDLGVNPIEELVKIWTYKRTGAALRLVLGDRAYGKHRWTIRDHTIKVEHTDARGNFSYVVVSLYLMEHIRR